MPTKIELKAAGEDEAARYLRRRGFRILDRNWSIRMGEIDIVATRGRTLVFVEVKTRSSSDFLDPSEGVDFRKQQKLRILAEAYLTIRKPDFEEARFDVVSIVWAGKRRPVVRHLASAF